MFAIAIDGPTGAGKSTLARMLAKEFGISYVDTGAMYRAIGLYVARQGLDKKDGAGIIGCLPYISLEIVYQDGAQRILLNGEDVSLAIRTEQASQYASAVSLYPQVRAFLLEEQRAMALRQPVVMDGRDIGTVVLPEAPIKIFLTATPESRARRRYQELVQRGEQVCYDDVLSNLIQRDQQDSSRAEAPLRAADDAVLLDTTELDLEQSFAAMKKIVEDKHVF